MSLPTASSLRVLQLVAWRQLRGAEVFAGQLSERLAVRGCRVVLAGLHAPGDPPLAARGVEVIDLSHTRPSRLSPSLLWKLRGLLVDFQPDVIQANGSNTLKYAVLARATIRKRPPLVYRSISIASRWLRGPLHRAWNRRLFQAADHVAAVSRLSGEDLTATYGLRPEVISLLPLGTPTTMSVDRVSTRNELAGLAGASPETPLLVHVGSFTREKDHPLLLEAFREVRLQCPEARLVLIGDGPERANAVDLVARRDLSGAVTFAGARPDAADLAGGADLLVLSSRIEGTPGAVLEAGARGVPAVSTDAGAVGEIIEHGATGLLTPPGDPSALARAIVELLRSPDRRAAMGCAARELAIERHDIERVADQFLELYRHLASRHD